VWGRRCRSTRTKQSVIFFGSARREVECVWIAAADAVTKCQRPQFVIHDVIAGFILERSQKCPGKRGERINDSVVGKVPDEQRSTEDSEAGWRNCQTPWSVERHRRTSVGSKRHVADTIRVKLADETQAWPILAVE